jgi:hypothetical protein
MYENSNSNQKGRMEVLTFDWIWKYLVFSLDPSCFVSIIEWNGFEHFSFWVCFVASSVSMFRDRTILPHPFLIIILLDLDLDPISNCIYIFLWVANCYQCVSRVLGF